MARSAPSWSATLMVARKELVSSLRDRQTVLYAIVLPIALYPVILWVLVQGALLVQGRDEHTTVRVELAAEDPAALPEGLAAALADPPEAPAGAPGRPGRAGPPGPALELVVDPEPTPRDAARARLELGPDGPDAVLWVPAPDQPGAEGEPGPAIALSGPRARLFHDSTRRASRLAVERVLERLEPFVLRERAAGAVARGADPSALIPFESEVLNMAPGRDMLAYTLSFLLPLLLVVMCVMGAFFPAVDLTAGEKERATEETTLVLPIPRASVHQGKILAVCCSAVVATCLNLAALGLSVGHLLDMLTGGTLGLAGFPVLALAAIAPLALLFAFFISSVLTGVASLARGYEEGQALLGPVQIVFIVPALVGVIPGIELSPVLCLVPVVNVALAFRGMLIGQVMPAEYALVAVSLLVYGLVAMRAAVWLLGRERRLRGAEVARWSPRRLLPRKAARARAS